MIEKSFPLLSIPTLTNPLIGSQEKEFCRSDSQALYQLLILTPKNDVILRQRLIDSFCLGIPHKFLSRQQEKQNKSFALHSHYERPSRTPYSTHCIYINVHLEYIPHLLRSLGKIWQEQKLSLEVPVLAPQRELSRPDKINLLVSPKELSKTVNLIESYATKHAEWFCSEKFRFTKHLAQGISIAEAPSKEQKELFARGGLEGSFEKVRSSMMVHALNKVAIGGLFEVANSNESWNLFTTALKANLQTGCNRSTSSWAEKRAFLEDIDRICFPGELLSEKERAMKDALEQTWVELPRLFSEEQFHKALTHQLKEISLWYGVNPDDLSKNALMIRRNEAL